MPYKCSGSVWTWDIDLVARQLNYFQEKHMLFLGDICQQVTNNLPEYWIPAYPKPPWILFRSPSYTLKNQMLKYKIDRSHYLNSSILKPPKRKLLIKIGSKFQSDIFTS